MIVQYNTIWVRDVHRANDNDQKPARMRMFCWTSQPKQLCCGDQFCIIYSALASESLSLWLCSSPPRLEHSYIMMNSVWKLTTLTMMIWLDSWYLLKLNRPRFVMSNIIRFRFMSYFRARQRAKSFSNPRRASVSRWKLMSTAFSICLLLFSANERERVRRSDKHGLPRTIIRCDSMNHGIIYENYVHNKFSTELLLLYEREAWAELLCNPRGNE